MNYSLLERVMVGLWCLLALSIALGLTSSVFAPESALPLWALRGLAVSLTGIALLAVGCALWYIVLDRE